MKRQNSKMGRTGTHHRTFSIQFKNVHTNGSYGCTVKRGNALERSIILPGRSLVSLAVTTPRRLQLCTVLRISTGQLHVHWYIPGLQPLARATSHDSLQSEYQELLCCGRVPVANAPGCTAAEGLLYKPWSSVVPTCTARCLHQRS